MSYVRESMNAIEDIYPDIPVEQATEFLRKSSVRFDISVAEVTGAVLGIILSAESHSMVDEMISNVRKAYEDLSKKNKIDICYLNSP